MEVKIVVLKIASRCNLNCSYCYMYNLGDKTYKNQPKVMSKETIENIYNRIIEHCEEHHIKNFGIILHGGEPLLAGQKYIEDFVNTGKRMAEGRVNFRYNLQTNGILLTEDIVNSLEKLRVHIGVSLDGPKEVNDKHRFYHNGKGSYDDVIKGINLLLNNRSYKERTGLLSVMNIDSDSIEAYDHLKSLDLKGGDFLFPYGTYDNPPLGKTESTENTYYADWLIKIFDTWYNEDETTRPSIRLFGDITTSIFGNDIMADYLGNKDNEVLVIETDGTMEAVDGLKSCGDGFTKTGANVSSFSINQALDTPLAKLYHYSHKHLCKKCRSCPINETCGGGDLANRYSSKNGFDNPSIYCSDLEKLISHIQNRVIDRLPQQLIEEAGIERLSPEKIQKIRNQNILEDNTVYTDELLSHFYAKA
ncbi:radical SAM protein [Chryseobacterium lactis]|uniref:Radical SAM protein n=2 Tax=Chryseobacterium lactis TaxID=1241981 RepID=A0A3G6RM40_CHRLC|nr:radical SAM protein [Chryseobacterium lactis]AZA83864.1 radical SAM protein [Chryseobacterium lactis]AZB04249.1 radical SAM protein [Chryseobacterium lactis]PNW12843.1 radical SAM protein [Chryseobacterium lactis]